MIRRVIQIDEENCTGCGLCVHACHEGAIGIVNGKATLLRDDYCDGLGDCLPTCPTHAISFVEREAAAYDEAAVQQNKHKTMQTVPHTGGGCPGSQTRTIRHDTASSDPYASAHSPVSELGNWPVQIKLAPPKAPYFDGAHLLIAADCTAYAYASFHRDFIRGKVTLIGCPKLDAVPYHEKLTEIIRQNDIQSVTIVRMEVPCCGGLEQAAITALQNSAKFLPWSVATITIDGQIKED